MKSQFSLCLKPHHFSRRRNVKKNLYVLMSLVVLASMVLAACGTPATATEAPAPATEPPAPATEAPVACEAAGTEPIAFPDGGKTVTGAWDQEPDSIVPYFSQMSF